MAGGATLDIESLRNGLVSIQREIATGVTTIRRVLESTDDVDRYLYIVKALESVPGVGKVRARAILADLGVAEHTRCGDLTSNQRREICERSGQSA